MRKFLRTVLSLMLIITILLVNVSVTAYENTDNIWGMTIEEIADGEYNVTRDEIINMGEGSWRIGNIYYDSEEALGISSDVVFLASEDGYGEISEYDVESKHFIFDENLYDDLTMYISPEVFNMFVQALNTGYETMCDLIGQDPVPYSKVLIRKLPVGADCDYPEHAQHTHGDKQMICWNYNSVGNILTQIQSRGLNDWWFSGTLHEVGHIFEYICPWDWAGEGWATYFAWITIQKNNAKMRGDYPSDSDDDIYDGFFEDIIPIEEDGKYVAYFNNPLDYYWHLMLPLHINATEPDFFVYRQQDILYLLNCIFNEYGWDKGYELLQEVFRSYFSYYSYKAESYEGTEKQRRLRDFIERCSYFTGVELETLWMDETKTLYSAALVPPTTPYIVLGDISLKVGDELKFSAYNCLSEGTYTVFYQLGNGQSFKTKSVDLHEGDNENISLGYTVKYSDIGEDFVIFIRSFGASGEYIWSEDTNVIWYTNIFANFEHDTSYSNGIFSLSEVELLTEQLASENVYFKINRYVGGECISIAEGDVSIDSSGKGNFSFEEVSFLLNSSGDYIEFNVYEDSTCQNLITGQSIFPITCVL